MDRLRVSLLAAALIAAPSAQADLYRWVDPATGSVKLSNYPPPRETDLRRSKKSSTTSAIGSS